MNTNKSLCLSEVHSAGVGGTRSKQSCPPKVSTFIIDGNKIFWKHRGQNYLMLICGVKESFTKKMTPEGITGSFKVYGTVMAAPSVFYSILGFTSFFSLSLIPVKHFPRHS